MYLDPMNGKEPMFAAAVRLLHNHGEMLDPLQVLEVYILTTSFSPLLVPRLYLFWQSLAPNINLLHLWTPYYVNAPMAYLINHDHHQLST